VAGGLTGKVALVTGGASGIGRATALVFAREGAKLIIADMNEEGAQQTAHLITENGGDAMALQVDVTRAVEVEAMISKALDTYGRLDCAHNNAGILGTPFIRVTECTEEEWDRIIDVNMKGVWLCMKYEIPQMLQQGGGAIVNTASAAGLIGSAAFPIYDASKHGVVGLTKSVALQYAKRGIRVNAVCPGVIQTPMVAQGIEANPRFEQGAIRTNPSGRLGNPEEVAEAVVWLCSDAASFVTAHAMSVDGGLLAQ
jgi:NAD(P)-dependent dehydrogenase (short-subunit alcohol dehydrogenase family)